MQTKILFYFALYSFLGWCLESVYKTILEKKFVNSGFLHGPFCPIYGFGAIIMIMLLQNLSNNIFLIFCISTIVLTIWEYLVSVLLEKVFKTKYWDYSDIKFNLQGRICLKNSIYWGILGIIFTIIIHPLIIGLVNFIPEYTLFYIDISIYIIIITDVIISVTKILFIDKKLQQLVEISDMIKEKITELKQNEKLGKGYKENIQDMIIDLKMQQDKLKIKLYKLIIRLKKAFPTMQSETINKLINSKIDLQLLRDKMRKKEK